LKFDSRLVAKAQDWGLAYLLATLATEIEFSGSFLKSPKGKGKDKPRIRELEPEPKLPIPSPQNPQEEEKGESKP
jgi:hypothetical protein